MTPNSSLRNKSFWKLYVNVLVLIEIGFSCFVISQKANQEKLWLIIFPALYVLLCCFNLWFSYNIFRGQGNRMQILGAGITLRVFSVLGNCQLRNGKFHT